MKRPRLLFVVNADWFFVSHRLRLGVACQEAGYEVHVAAPASGAHEKIIAAGLGFHDIPIDRGGTNPLRDSRTLAALLHLYRSLKPDVVHHVTIKPNLYGGIAAKLLGIPSVHAVSGLGFVFIEQSEGRMAHRVLKKSLAQAYRAVFLRRRNRIIFQNPTDQAEFIAAGLAAAERTVLLPGSGINPEIFWEAELPAGPPIVLLPARLLRDKGVSEFVEAARIVHRTMPEARFVLAGMVDPGNPAGISEEDVRDWVKEEAVEWFGGLPPEEMPDLYRSATLVVLPSYREGLPLVLAEAAACGRACVTTDVPGCRDAMLDGETGWLVPVRESEPLAAAIAEALGDREGLVKRSKRAARFARETFDERLVFDGTLQVYADLGVDPE